MSRVGDQSDGRHSLGVTGPGMNGLLGEVAFLWRLLGAQVDIQVLWNVEVRPALVVVGIFDCTMERKFRENYRLNK